MRRTTLLCAAATLLTACDAPERTIAPAPAPLLAASAIHQQFITPFDLTWQSTCHGEAVRVQGTIHERFAGVSNANGGVGISGMNGQGLTGVGLTSGDEYRLIQQWAATTTRVNATTDALAATFRLVRVGGGDAELLRVRFHMTFNANLERTVFIDSVVSECTA